LIKNLQCRTRILAVESESREFLQCHCPKRGRRPTHRWSQDFLGLGFSVQILEHPSLSEKCFVAEREVRLG
jgi:hypothetical protein